MGFDKKFAIFLDDVAVTVLDIEEKCTGTPPCFVFFIKMNNK